VFHDIIVMRNASNTPSNTHFSTHSLWLVEIHMGSTKFIWDPHNLVGPMWIWTNQRKYVEKCVLECVLLAFLSLSLLTIHISHEIALQFFFLFEIVQWSIDGFDINSRQLLMESSSKERSNITYSLMDLSLSLVMSMVVTYLLWVVLGSEFRF